MVVGQKSGSQLEDRVSVGLQGLVALFGDCRSLALGRPLHESGVQGRADLRNQVVDVKVPLEVRQDWGQLGGTVPLILGQVVLVNALRVEDGSALTRGQLVLLAEGLFVVHLCFGVAFELRQTVRVVVLVGHFDGVQQANLRLDQDLCAFGRLVLHDLLPVPVD